MLLEVNDERQFRHSYMQTEAMAELIPPIIDAASTQITTAVALSVATPTHPILYHPDAPYPG